MSNSPSAAASLAETIRSELSSGRFAQLLKTLKVAKLPDEDFSSALQAGISDSGPDFSAVAEAIVASLKARLQPNSFADYAAQQANRTPLLESFDLLTNSWLAEIEQLIRYYDFNVEAVRKYRPKLLARRTQVLSRDKWGDTDFDAWNQVMVEFAREHFIGPDRASFLEIAPLEVRLHFIDVKAQDLSGRFVWLELELLQVQDKDGSTSANAQPNHQNGIEFELHIKRILQEAVPTAVVETTPASGDQGADLIFSTANARIVIQAKRYTGTVGNSAVQEVHAARGFYDASAAVVVTNSTYTQSARDLAAELGVALLHEDEIASVFTHAFT